MSKSVVFRAHLLLGDAIYAVAVIGRYVRDNPDHKVIIECLDEYPQEVYTWIPGRPELTYATDTVCDERYVIDPTAAMHHAVEHKQGIWKSMGAVLGLPADDTPLLAIPRTEVPIEWKNAFIISPFSRSCSSHSVDENGVALPANKTFPTRTWVPLIRYLRRHSNVLFVSARNERFDTLSLDESERIAGFPLSVVASIFAQARCVISVDNGLARLATLVGANTITLMPEFLPLEVFAPAVWAINTSRVAQIDVRMDANAFTAAMKHMLRIYAGVI